MGDLAPQKNEIQIESLIAQAIEKNIPVETMERLLAMRNQLKAEWAKEQYDSAMAAFQAECPIIEKTKVVKTNTGALAYKYAPIESIVNQVKGYLEKHGFSYAIQQQFDDAGRRVKIVCTVKHKDGHSESYDMEVPLGTKTQMMSETQVVAAASTFAKRYAFCNAFGILTGDEDTDAVPQSAPHAKQAEPRPLQRTKQALAAMIDAVQSVDELRKVWSGFTPEEKTLVSLDKDAKKIALENEIASFVDGVLEEPKGQTVAANLMRESMKK